MPPAADAQGPTWMLIALGALALLQIIAGYFLARAGATLDRVTRLSEQHEVKIEAQEREIARLRDRTPHGPTADAQQAMAAFAETARLLMQELREVRSERHRGIA